MQIEDIRGDFDIDVGFLNYPNICGVLHITGPELPLFDTSLYLDKDLECISTISVLPKNIKFRKFTYTCRLDADSTCTIRIKCKNFEAKVQAYVDIEVLNIVSYSTGITVNISTQSSIPNKISTVSSKAIPKKKNIFVGTQLQNFSLH